MPKQTTAKRPAPRKLLRERKITVSVDVVLSLTVRERTPADALDILLGQFKRRRLKVTSSAGIPMVLEISK